MTLSSAVNTSIEAIDQLKKFLPTQAPLPFFVHHNPLHAWDAYPFEEGTQKASALIGIRGFMPHSYYKNLYLSGKILPSHIELAFKEVYGRKPKPEDWGSLFGREERTEKKNRIIDYWQSKYSFHLQKHSHSVLFRWISAYVDRGVSYSPLDCSIGFLNALNKMELMSGVRLFNNIPSNRWQNGPSQLPEVLERLVGNEVYTKEYLFNQQFAHPGWSGMVNYLENHPSVFGKPIKISLLEFIYVECLIEINALNGRFGESWKPMMQGAIKSESERQDTLADNWGFIWLKALEKSIQEPVFQKLKKQVPSSTENVEYDVLFCIDDRECSIRRHLESGRCSIRTWGTPGFFHLPLEFKKDKSALYEKICPLPLSPEIKVNGYFTNGKEKWAGTSEWFRLIANPFHPKKLHESVDSFDFKPDEISLNKDPELDSAFWIEKLVVLFQTIGLTDKIGQLVYLIGHGASSTNNPYYAGYDCGACSGRPGSINALLAARLLNNTTIRFGLAQKGIQIPEKTHFIGALHDTTQDRIAYFDESSIPENHRKRHSNFVKYMDASLAQNAHERAKLLESKCIKPIDSLKKVRKRAWALFQPRPEWNHARNAFCIIGPRENTRGINLDRRAFLQSYNPKTDAKGDILGKILSAVIPVCGGINLEYYFSTVDPQRLGAGSKLPHNVVGLLGVSNGVGGDLRTGLPEQMITVHEPVRLTCIIYQKPEIIKDVLNQNSALSKWFDGEWVLLFAFHPENRKIWTYKKGTFLDQPEFL